MSTIHNRPQRYRYRLYRSPPHTAIRIAAPVATAAGPLSRVRKRFNTLAKKLETKRVRLAPLARGVAEVPRVGRQRTQPVVPAFDVHRRQLLLRLDQAFSDATISKNDRKKPATVIRSAALNWLQIDDQDEANKQIYNKYSGCDFDLVRDTDTAFMRKMVGAATGVKLDDDNHFSSTHIFFEAMRNKMGHGKKTARTQTLELQQRLWSNGRAPDRWRKPFQVLRCNAGIGLASAAAITPLA